MIDSVGNQRPSTSSAWRYFNSVNDAFWQTVASVRPDNIMRDLAEQAASSYLVMTGERTAAQEFPRITGWVQHPRAMWRNEVRSVAGTYLDASVWLSGNYFQGFDSAVHSFIPAIPAAVGLAYGVGPAVANDMTLGDFFSNSTALASRTVDTVGTKIFGELPPGGLTTTGVMVPVVEDAVMLSPPTLVVAEPLVPKPLLVVMSLGPMPKFGPETIRKMVCSDLEEINDIGNCLGIVARFKNSKKNVLRRRRAVSDLLNDIERSARQAVDRVDGRAWLHGLDDVETQLNDNRVLFGVQSDADSLLVKLREIRAMPDADIATHETVFLTGEPDPVTGGVALKPMDLPRTPPGLKVVKGEKTD